MWINQANQAVNNNEQYTDEAGTTYPGNFPKSEIPGLTFVVDPDPIPPTPEELADRQAAEIKALVVTATQQRLDDFARTRSYDGILSACTYAPSLIDRFRADGVYCVGARDNTWAALYAFMAEVQAGTKPFPTGFADIEPLLPVLSWPL